jgi:acylphosphatase
VKESTARRYFVSGMVQGVGFRFFAIRLAERLGLAGFVKNLRDGRVEVYAIGPSAALAALRRELERGPSGAIVHNVAEEEAPLDPQFEKGFSIEHDGW